MKKSGPSVFKESGDGQVHPIYLILKINYEHFYRMN